MINRELDGVYFRVNREDKWQNICFTDLTDREAEKVLENRSEKWISSLCDRLEEVLVEIKTVINSQIIDDAIDKLLEMTHYLPLKDRAMNLKNTIKNLADYYDLGVND